MTSHLAEQLKTLALHCPEELLLEKFRREWLFYKVFEQQVPSHHREDVRQGFKRLLNIAITLDMSCTLVIAGTVDETIALPESINKYLEEWLIAARYLAYGNADIERQLPPELYAQAKTKATAAVANIMNESFSFEKWSNQ